MNQPTTGAPNVASPPRVSPAALLKKIIRTITILDKGVSMDAFDMGLYNKLCVDNIKCVMAQDGIHPKQLFAMHHLAEILGIVQHYDQCLTPAGLKKRRSSDAGEFNSSSAVE